MALSTLRVRKRKAGDPGRPNRSRLFGEKRSALRASSAPLCCRTGLRTVVSLRRSHTCTPPGIDLVGCRHGRSGTTQT
jgi:hypothetical protein